MSRLPKTLTQPLPALAFSQIRQQYQQRLVLDDLAITLTAGRAILLTGDNGSGKTTLMRILSGLEKPDQAYLSVNNQRYRWTQCRAFLQHNIMYLHQQAYLFSGSVRQNLAYALPRSLPRHEQQQRLTAISTWAGLETLLDTSARQLSGGECQRVALARALLRQPQVLLLDEPSANMDQAARLKTTRLLEQLRHQGMALLISSHDPALFVAGADEHIHLQR